MTRPSDHELDLEVATMLRWGVTIAACVVLAGGTLYLSHAANAIPDYTHFHAASATTLASTLRAALHLDPAAIMQVGLFVLIATPIARVALCIVGFARQRSRLYVAISTFVLLVLLFSLAHKA